MTHSPALQGSALEQAGAVITETSLRFSDPHGITWEQYENLGEFLSALGRAYPFWVGDFLLYGEEIFGEQFSQIEASLPQSAHTLVNYRSVCKRVPRSRRRSSLSFSVHAEVAYLEPRERDRWLEQAERNDWKREQMREALHHARLVSGNSGPMGNLAVTNEPNATPTGSPHVCPACGYSWNDGQIER